MRTRNTEKEQLVKQKAMEHLVQYGIDGFSMNKLAKACNISVATLYIYYRDKDDLILSIALEEAQHMCTTMLKGFDPASGFETGLRQQWKNRSSFIIRHPLSAHFLEQLKSTEYFQEKIFSHIADQLRPAMSEFLSNAIANDEIDELPIEVYWCVAFGPLYTLLRFHHEGQSVGGKKFAMTDKMLWQTFDLVLRALKKQ